MAKEFTIHLRIGDLLHERIVAEGERLGLSQSDTVRYLLTKCFEAKTEVKDQGGGA
jgi:antitoxin component of RelBE/YafQ-DinJ toxin-antitoxin module